jgi:lysyl-tRNA synthetase class 2
MTFAPLDSSSLASAAFDPHHNILRVEFRDRAVYVFWGVPATLHDALLKASSKGAFFNRSIRGKFPFCRLQDRAR